MERPREHLRSLWAVAAPHNAPLTRAGAAQDAYEQAAKFSPASSRYRGQNNRNDRRHEARTSASVLLLATCLEDTSFRNRETLTSPGVRNAPKRRTDTDRSRERKRGRDAAELPTRHPSRTLLPSHNSEGFYFVIAPLHAASTGGTARSPARRSQVSYNDDNKKPRLFGQAETGTNQPADISKYYQLSINRFYQ